MNELQKSFIENSSSFLIHYNHNHDKLGRFARSNGTSGSVPKRKDPVEWVLGFDSPIANKKSNKITSGSSSSGSSGKDFYKAFKTKSKDRITDIQRKALHEIVTDPRVLKAKEKVDKALEPVQEYWNNDKIQNKYASIAGAYSANSFGENKPEDRVRSRWFFILEDGDQGSTSSINFFLLDKGYDLDTVHYDVQKADDEYRKTLNDVIALKTGEYGNKEVPSWYGGKSSLNKEIADKTDWYDYGTKNDYIPQTWKVSDVKSNGKSSDNAMKKYMRGKYRKDLEEDYKYLLETADDLDKELLPILEMEYKQLKKK